MSFAVNLWWWWWCCEGGGFGVRCLGNLQSLIGFQDEMLLCGSKYEAKFYSNKNNGFMEVACKYVSMQCPTNGLIIQYFCLASHYHFYYTRIVFCFCVCQAHSSRKQIIMDVYTINTVESFTHRIFSHITSKSVYDISCRAYGEHSQQLFVHKKIKSRCYPFSHCEGMNNFKQWLKLLKYSVKKASV